MPLTPEERQQFEQQCYGCNIVDWVDQVEDSLTYKISGPVMVLTSLLSDVQERIARPTDQNLEEARQDINRIKHLIDHWYTKRP